MRVEEITKSNVDGLSTDELKKLRHRAVQMFDRTELGRRAIAKRTVGISEPVGREAFLGAYDAIMDELGRRGVTWRKTDLDVRVLKRRLRRVDVAELPPIRLVDAAVCLTGKFVADPKHAEAVEVWIGDGLPTELEKRLAEALMDQSGKSIAVVDDPEDPVLPCYDLVLVPRPDAEYLGEGAAAGLAKRREPVSKPAVSEHHAPQEAGDYKEYARTNDKLGAGIHVVYGITAAGKSKIASIRFDAKKFTAAQAKAWLKEHGYKTKVDAATGKVKKQAVPIVDGRVPAPERRPFLKIRSEEERLVGGIVYAPGEVDGQGDWTDAEEIWKAMKSHMIDHAGTVQVMHDGVPRGMPIVECFVAEADTVKAGDCIPAGAWYLAVYVPPEMESLWKKIKAGEIGGFSMSGTADVEEEEED